jgi:hypothetical protein
LIKFSDKPLPITLYLKFTVIPEVSDRVSIL